MGITATAKVGMKARRAKDKKSPQNELWAFFILHVTGGFGKIT
jgi:hypothetical protein